MNVEKFFPGSQIIISDLIDACHRLYENGFVCAYDGNVSMRVGKHILITPTHLCKGKITAEDLIIVDNQGNKVYGTKNPSSEMKVHLAVYESRPDVKCVIHAHPLYATAFYRDGRKVNCSLLTEASDSLGEVPVLPYEMPGSQALAESVKYSMETGTSACILEKHGVVVVGNELDETYYLLESLERLAKTETILATMKL